jgi:small conductance mechanosensitive channel
MAVFGAFLLTIGYAVALIAAGWLLAAWLGAQVRWRLDRARVDAGVREIVVLVVEPLVVLIAVVAALESVGVRLDAVVALLAVGTLVLGLAATGTLSNAVSGAWLLSNRPYKQGDDVTLAGREGTVLDFTLFSTTIRTAGGSVITLPNKLVADAPIENRGQRETG